jgi:hypothetical protein
VKVAHPLMLRAIAAAKKKNDRIDAAKIADCLLRDFLPQCHMAPTEIRAGVGFFANATWCRGRLMETGVTYDKLRLHRMGYFSRLLSSHEEIRDRVRPLLKLCREYINRSI